MGRGYDAGDTRYSDHGLGWDRAGKHDEDRYVTAWTRDKIRSLCMDGRRNDPLIQAACKRIVDFCAGPDGLILQAATDNDAVNAEYDQYFKEWSNRCDFLGVLSFGDYQRLMIDADEHSGDCLIMRLSNGQLQGIEGEHIRQPHNVPETASQYDGMRLNSIGQITAFCIHKRDKSGQFSGLDYEWVDAAACYHWSDRWRFDMMRSLPELACGIIPARHIKDANDSTLTQVRAQAKPAMATETFTGNVAPSGRSAARTAQSVNKTRVEELDGATLYHFLQGEGGLKFAAPTTPNSNLTPFLTFNMRRFAAITGFAYEVLMLDMTGGNFSQNKMMRYCTQAAIDTKQKRLAKFVQFTRSWQIARGVARKEIPPAPFIKGRSQFADVRVIKPPQTWADDADQIGTDTKEIQAGLASYSEKAGRKGQDIEEIWRHKISDLVLLKKLCAEASKDGLQIKPEDIAVINLPGAQAQPQQAAP